MTGPIIKDIKWNNPDHFAYLQELAQEICDLFILIDSANVYLRPKSDREYKFQVAIEHVFKSHANQMPNFSWHDLEKESDRRDACERLWHYVCDAEHLVDSYDAISDRDPQYSDKFKWIEYVPSSFDIICDY